MSKLRTYLALGSRERALFRSAWFWLAATRLALNTLGLRRTQALLVPNGVHATAGNAEGEPAIGELVKWMEVAARNMPGGANCLPRSVALLAVLRRRGIAGELRFGVRGAGIEVEAHAWVEVRGQPVNDTADVSRRFAVLEARAA